ncbi:MAG TPA: flagellar basal body L-ring protein FlgH [Candidatus Hydrogenedentes bacterium]|nr:flagellar basal body L-ring protein FlgH [Candidatus Hydrogenedentota bacterium]HOV72963.1 flagellar basal body L-ring protein FlgH [Candidatus Hydrogenedentota bacterium]HPC15809.1 flagellar basal body L-ring protein FlgH [Candidatus Hydrogenedentota bacterium]HRT19782.1 flagellar basal body L-ring protein FlgH [Candidatus Hydrogenedentota bacterium]HRT64556.1 flagellar basal body L-ring protein FlgH [Candidatus Hydrogenedentota bacterium]
MKRRVMVFMALAALAPAAAFADSLFQASNVRKTTLIAKHNRFEVGDVITVLIQEKINASTTSNTNTKKESTVQSEAPMDASNTFLTDHSNTGLGIVSKEALPNWDIQAKNELKARGQTDRVAQLTTSISCLVTRVDDSGNLHIEGDKTVSMNREDSTIHVSGIVRARDVTPANTVLSTQVANAQIILRGKGPLWNSQRRGLITRMLDWFSPF